MSLGQCLVNYIFLFDSVRDRLDKFAVLNYGYEMPSTLDVRDLDSDLAGIVRSIL
jgi:hypothetical protein